MLRSDLGCTYKRAGELVGRDHASVIKYNKDHEGNFRYYQDYKVLYREVQSRYINEFKGVKFKIIQQQIEDLQEQLEVIKKQQEY